MINWIFALSLCAGSYYYTIHGLWNTQTYCYGKPFNKTALNPIAGDLKKAWRSCPGFNHTNSWLWSHEWNKHGKCFNITQLEYFNLTLTLWYRYSSLCDLFNGGDPQCYIHIYT